MVATANGRGLTRINANFLQEKTETAGERKLMVEHGSQKVGIFHPKLSRRRDNRVTSVAPMHIIALAVTNHLVSQVWSICRIVKPIKGSVRECFRVSAEVKVSEVGHRMNQTKLSAETPR